jgi:hypothetical protein
MLHARHLEHITDVVYGLNLRPQQLPLLSLLLVMLPVAVVWQASLVSWVSRPYQLLAKVPWLVNLGIMVVLFLCSQVMI